MQPTRFRILMDLVGDALEHPKAEREAWLERACTGDHEMLVDARALLFAGDADEASLTRGLEQSIGQEAERVRDSATAPPHEIGPYRIVEELGEGGMGVVYGAEQETPIQRRVALKVLRPAMRTARNVERFDAERRMLASLEHPGIARILDAGTTVDGAPFFAMEWVVGQPITGFCDGHRMPIRARVALFRRVLGAVQHAHERAIIHRDLKPSNVLVTEVDGEAVPKVIDFGIARVDEGGASRTAHGAVLGTIEYMSPEQALTPSEVGTRSDVYALGVLLYELLTGRLPWDSETLRAATPTELEHLLRDREATAPSRRAAESAPDALERAASRATDPRRLARLLEGDLDNIVRMAIHPDATHRYESVAHFSDDLGRYVDGRPVRARPSTWRYRTGRFVQRHRWAVTGVGAALVVLTAQGAAFTLSLTEERDRARLEADKAAAVADFLQETFRVSDPYTSGNRDVAARELLDSAAERVTAELTEQPELQASLLAVLGNTYAGLGLPSEAARSLEASLERQRRLHGERDPEVASRLHELGIVRGELGDMDGAEEAFRQALALRTELFGEDDPRTATTEALLAGALRTRGRYEEAETLARASVGALRRAGPDERLALAQSVHILAFVLSSEARYHEAEALYREALALRTARLDPTHPDLVSTMLNLASVLEDEGSYDESESLLREVVRRRLERLGPDHPGTLGALNNLAYALSRAGRYLQADSSLTEVVRIGHTVFEGDHRTLAILINNLGVSKRRLGDLPAADRLHREALAMDRRLYGGANARIAGDMDNLGRVLLLEGDAVAADTLHRAALAMRTEVEGADHPDVAESLSGLANARLALADTAEAERLMRTALRIRVDALGEDGRDAVTSRYDLGVLLGRIGKEPEAEALLRSALAERRTAFGAGHPEVAATMYQLAIVVERRGKTKEANSLLSQSLRITRAVLGDAHPETRRVREALAALGGG